MAKSTYISANATEEQLRFLKALDDNEVLYFNLHNIQDLIGGSFKNTNELVENLAQKELLVRLERGKYARSTFSEINPLASFVSNGGVIAYWSALHHYGLTDRFPNKVFVKTNMRKRNTTLLGSQLHFVSVSKTKMNLGKTRVGYGDIAYPITDLEMTLVDCFDQPRYAGDFPDLLQAFAQPKLDASKLKDYCKAYRNTAVLKRLGYLAELLQKPALKSFVDYAKKNGSKRFTLFDAGGPDQGEFINDWKLRLNLSKEAILEITHDDSTR